jgi:hypothetical protein
MILDILLRLLIWRLEYLVLHRCSRLTEDIYGADLLGDRDTAFVLEGITRKVEKEMDQAKTSETLIGILDMIAR